MIIVRENTEDLYCGKPEVWVDDDTCEATKRITRGASARIGKLVRFCLRACVLKVRSGGFRIFGYFSVADDYRLNESGTPVNWPKSEAMHVEVHAR